MLILLADDERMARICTQKMIEELFPGQHSFIHAKNGLEAVRLLESKPYPDIAFIDYKMPYKNGVEVIQAARSVNPHTRNILLSGCELGEHRLFISYFSAVLLKPASLEDIRKAMG
jgi:two-component system response regulator YesN